MTCLRVTRFLRSMFLAAGLVAALAGPLRAVGVGDMAPDFLLEDVRTGEAISLSDHRGQVVVLIFFAVG